MSKVCEGCCKRYNLIVATTALLSEEEYLRTSFPDVDREFYDGEVRERSLPDLPHVSAVKGFLQWFFAHEADAKLFAYADLRIRVAPNQHRIPDISVFWPEVPKGRRPGVPPLIAIEILSLDDRLFDVRNKLAGYRDYGVRHVWLAEPEPCAFSVFDGKLREVDVLEIPEVNLTITPADVFGER